MFYFVVDEIAQDLGLINKTIKSLDFGECILQCDGDLVNDYVFDLVHLMFDCPTETAYEVRMNCSAESNYFNLLASGCHQVQISFMPLCNASTKYEVIF